MQQVSKHFWKLQTVFLRQGICSRQLEEDDLIKELIGLFADRV